MDYRKCTSFGNVPSVDTAPVNFVNKIHTVSPFEEQKRANDPFVTMDVDVDLQEVYFLIMHFLSTGPCQKTFRQLWEELVEHELLPRRYHAYYSRSGTSNGLEKDTSISFPLNYDNIVNRYPHIQGDHLLKLLRQLMLTTAPPLRHMVGKASPSASDVPTLLGTGAFSLLFRDRSSTKKQEKNLPSYLRWPHMQIDQVRGLSLREIGGGFPKHHRAPSIRFPCYAVAKPSTMVQKMQKKIIMRGHRDAVYCAIFDRSGRYVITGSDDRLVKIWSMETAFCLCSCRGHEGDITDLAVSLNNMLVASASNDYTIRVWRLPDGYPISVLRGHIGAVTAIAFSPRAVYQLLSSSDDGTCRIWDARQSNSRPRVYLPKPVDAASGKSRGVPLTNVSSSSSNAPNSHQILCCAYNANGTIFVTGSSDTYARVWSACKSNFDDPEQPCHEIDLLGGHENDVNYVQFSGCAVSSRTSTSESLMEENIPKFKNSWFSHDNIVTCSRDGSAIIWTPKLRRSQGKVGRWVQAYHLKVPPPPMPPQPRRGGPRQRLLPTPRGVNMIVWSLDNRFVLAAIMDNRICVWNASDGSLVHSLTGHDASTYVLDVHPFNPRIAMSAGYDGKTIIWDIWEGIPISIYQIGRFKLVDGKFSQDGTSVVLSDDVGQIYLLITGQGESQQDAKYDQFFLGDYRPLVRDTQGNILDQETQMIPYMRNTQDLLCDSSMLPYPEPYQSMYQRRRLGAMGIEWRPSSIKLAVGPDIGLGPEYQVLPLLDLNMVFEPLPDFLDSMYLEPENDVVHDETDSEYYITDEFSSEDEQEGLSDSSSSNIGSSEEDIDRLRRSKRRRPSSEVELMTASGARVKRNTFHEHNGTLSWSKRTKRSRNCRKTSSTRKSTKVKSLRPQRIAARNAINGFSHVSEISTDGEEGSESDSSESESSLWGTNIKNEKFVDTSHGEKGKHLADEQLPLVESNNAVKYPKETEHQLKVENRKRLVLKFSIRNSVKSLPPESDRIQSDYQETVAPSFPSGDSGQSSSAVSDFKLVKDSEVSELLENEEPKSTQENLEISGYKSTKAPWGEVKLHTVEQLQLGDLKPVHLDHRSEVSPNIDCETRILDALVEPENGCMDRPANSEIGNSEPSHFNKRWREKQKCEASASNDPILMTNKDFCPKDVGKSSSSNLSLHLHEQIGLCNNNPGKGCSPELVEVQKSKPTILKIKTKKFLQGCSAVKIPHRDEDMTFESPFPVGLNLEHHAQECDRTEFSEGTSDTSMYNENVQDEFPDIATDATRRKRSLRLKATSREADVMNYNSNIRDSHLSISGRSAERLSRKALDPFPTRGLQTSKPNIRSRSSKNYYECRSTGAERNSYVALKKSNWLLLSEQEEGYRYIPQLGDIVVYLVQGHQEYIESCRSSERVPWKNTRGKIRAAEVCSVEDLEYSALPGSGESCCKITLTFTDSTSALVGQKFQLTLPELIDFPDFVVEKTRYDAAMNRNWSCRDKCLVWWRDDSEEGGNLWEGRIVSLKDKSSDFPGSPWERCVISYKSDPTNTHCHSPWELHDPDCLWVHPQVDADKRNRILSYFHRLLQSASTDQDYYGILKLEDASQKESFINRFPVPLSPEIVKLRLENNYYRSLESVKHDIMVMLTNGLSYFAKQKEISLKIKRLSDWFNRKLCKF